MIKQTLGLLLGAAIFTASSLFAMDRDEEQEFALHAMPKDVIVKVVSTLPVMDVVGLSSTSKAMKTLLETPIIWENILERAKEKRRPELEARDQVIQFFSLFRDVTKRQSVKVFELISWKKEPYPMPGKSVSYCFSLGKRKFQLTNGQAARDRLELLNENDDIIFEPKPLMDQTKAAPTIIEGKYTNAWEATFLVCTNLEKVKGLKFNSPEYVNIANGLLITAESIGNCFEVKEIKEKNN